MRQILVHRDAAALKVIGQAVIGEKHIIDAEEVIGRDVLVGIYGVFDFVSDDVSGILRDLLGAVDGQLVTVDVRDDLKLEFDITRFVRFVKRFGQLHAGGALQRLEIAGGVDGLPVYAVLAGLNDHAAGQPYTAARLIEEAAHKRADRAFLSQVINDRPAQPVGETEVSAVGIGCLRGKYAVGEHRRIFFGVIVRIRNLRAERTELLDLLRQAGNEILLLRIIALGGIPVFRLGNLGDDGIAIVIVHIAGILLGILGVDLSLVFDRRHLVNEQPGRRGSADFVPDIAGRYGTRQTDHKRIRLGA